MNSIDQLTKFFKNVYKNDPNVDLNADLNDTNELLRQILIRMIIFTHEYQVQCEIARKKISPIVEAVEREIKDVRESEEWKYKESE